VEVRLQSLSEPREQAEQRGKLLLNLELTEVILQWQRPAPRSLLEVEAEELLLVLEVLGEVLSVEVLEVQRMHLRLVVELKEHRKLLPTMAVEAVEEVVIRLVQQEDPVQALVVIRVLPEEVRHHLKPVVVVGHRQYMVLLELAVQEVGMEFLPHLQVTVLVVVALVVTQQLRYRVVMVAMGMS
jgi:hypothetical protein